MTRTKSNMGRKKGTRAAAPRAKRTLTDVQRLREHILLELGLEKGEIAEALGTTRQTVCNIFLDEHRSELEDAVIEYLRDKYDAAPIVVRDRILVLVESYMPRDWDLRLTTTISAETLGWSKRSSPEHQPQPQM